MVNQTSVGGGYRDLFCLVIRGMCPISNVVGYQCVTECIRPKGAEMFSSRIRMATVYQPGHVSRHNVSVQNTRTKNAGVNALRKKP